MHFLPNFLSRLAAEDPAGAEQEWEWSGDANASVLIAGHSNREAYRAAVAEGCTSSDTRVAVLRPKEPIPSIPPPLDEAYWREACGAPARVLAVVWNGNQHNGYFMFDFDEPLRLHDCGELGRVVPASMVSAYWEPSFHGLETAVVSPRAEHVVLVGTPPPNSDEATRARLPHSGFFVQALAAAGESFETVRITPAAVRVGLWKILQADLEAWSARIGAVFVPVPDIAQAADGCLKPEYSSNDATHANGPFGALMLGEIEAAVARAEVV